MNVYRDIVANYHLRAVFHLFDEGRQYRLYAWNVSQRRYEYLDGRVRRYCKQRDSKFYIS